MPATLEFSAPSTVPARKIERVSAPRTARIALLGCGTVGSEVGRILIESRQRIARSTGIDLDLARILVRDQARPRRGKNLDPALFTTDFAEILDGHPDIVIELMGGLEPAATCIQAALERGISVVTANKSVIAHHGERLRQTVARFGAALAYEGSVGAAIPVLAALRQLAADDVRTIRGVLNGTCNYILTRMSAERLTLQQSLSAAIAQGFAEPDPSADISGRDSAEKLCVLAQSLGGAGLAANPRCVVTRGIEDITPEVLDAARRRGCAVKLLAELSIDEHGLDLRVGPTLVSRRHALAQAQGQENIVEIESAHGGRLLLQGQGAGPGPTASAVLGDVLGVLRHGAEHLPPPPPSRTEGIADRSEPRRRFIRVSGGATAPRPEYVLDPLRGCGIDVEDIEFRAGTVELVTRAISDASASAARTALESEGHRVFEAGVLP